MIHTANIKMLESSKLLMTKCSKSPAAKSIIPMVTNENITKYIFCLIIDYPYCPSLAKPPSSHHSSDKGSPRYPTTPVLIAIKCV